MNWGQNSATNTTKTTPNPSPYSTQYSSPTHQFANNNVNNNVNQQLPASRGPSTPIHQQSRSPSEPQHPSKADYSRSHFAGTNNTAGGSTGIGGVTAAGTGVVGGDIFADILGQQGYNFASKSNQGPRSINAMRKEEIIKDMDPEKLKILEWVSNYFCARL